jgi:hypothetical protein
VRDSITADLRIFTSGLNKGLEAGASFRDFDTAAVAAI